MSAFREYGKRTFSSLAIRNYRLYFIGQIISQSGSWMQTVALGWLVLDSTHSGTQLGIVTALQFIPLLICGPWGGLFADRHSKRKILYGTQTAFTVLVGTLSLIVLFDMVHVWMLYIFALGLGVVRIFDNPVRQVFMSELVPRDQLKNAISLSATGLELARVIGPAIGGFLIALFGIATCFIFNAFSSLVVVGLLLRMDGRALNIAPREERGKNQIKAGFAYIMATPVIRKTLILIAFIGTFAYEFPVSLPLFAERALSGGVTEYALLLSAFGVGSVVGGIFAAGRHVVVPHRLTDFALMFGVAIVCTALAPHMYLALCGMVFVGFFSINLVTLGKTMIQLESAPQMRGRVLSLWSMSMIGSTAIGGPIVGMVGEHIGARFGLALGGLVSIVVALYFARSLFRMRLIRIIPAWLVRESL